jgi:hypothetical protein
MDQMEYANEMQKIRKVGSLSPTPPLHLYNDIHPPSGFIEWKVMATDGEDEK